MTLGDIQKGLAYFNSEDLDALDLYRCSHFEIMTIENQKGLRCFGVIDSKDLSFDQLNIQVQRPTIEIRKTEEGEAVTTNFEILGNLTTSNGEASPQPVIIYPPIRQSRWRFRLDTGENPMKFSQISLLEKVIFKSSFTSIIPSEIYSVLDKNVEGICRIQNLEFLFDMEKNKLYKLSLQVDSECSFPILPTRDPETGQLRKISAHITLNNERDKPVFYGKLVGELAICGQTLRVAIPIPPRGDLVLESYPTKEIDNVDDLTAFAGDSETTALANFMPPKFVDILHQVSSFKSNHSCIGCS